MPVTVTTRQSWGSRLMSSIAGVLVGFIMFIAAFPVLWMNEGRINKAILAEETTEISGDEVDAAYDTMPVSTTAIVTSDETLGDIFLKEGEYLTLNRKVEMYAWKEVKEETTTTRTGGSTETTTTYDYVKEWTESPANSSNFYDPSYSNPTKALESEAFKVNNAKVGVYDVDMKDIRTPGGDKISLTEENTIIEQDPLMAEEILLTNGYIFQGIGTFNQPAVGDYRISYTASPLNEEVTVFGTLNGTKIEPYIGKRDTKLYRMFASSRSAAIETLNMEHKMITWGLRFLGFFLMWAGLAAVLKPISTFLDVLPILGKISGFMISVVTFVTAFVLSLVTIIVASIFYNVIALIVVILAILGGTYYKFKDKDLTPPTKIQV